MRILYVTAHYPPDFVSGATLQVRRLAAEAAMHGHDVAVLAGAVGSGLADGEQREERDGDVAVRWIGTASRVDQAEEGNWRNPLAVAAAVELYEEWRPDVVHAHTLQTLGADLLGEAARRGIPTFVTMHDLWWWCARLFLVDRYLRPCPVDTRTSPCACARDREWRLHRADSLGAVLDTVGQVFVPSAGLRDVVVANGLDPGRVAVDANDLGSVGDLLHPSPPPPPGTPVRFMYVGGGDPLKGRDVLLDASRRLRRVDGWTLSARGVARPSRPANRWRRDPWPHVQFAPPYAPEETATVMGDADVLVLPSIARESFSLVVREALAAGLAVITSDCLGPEEVVVDGHNGLVVPTGDAGALAAAMARLVSDRGELARLRAAAAATPPLRSTAEHVASLLARYAAAL